MIYVGDDWAEDHHDVELVDQDGHRLIRARLTEGLEGITRLHDLIGAHQTSVLDRRGSGRGSRQGCASGS
jgi:hypothetical protein